MHWRGFLEGGNVKGTYEDVVSEVVAELHARVEAVIEGGIAPEHIVVDPGLGFSKEAAHDLKLLAHLEELRALGHPLLVAASRKRFLGHVLAGDQGAPPRHASATPPRRPSPRSRPIRAPGRSASTRSAPRRTRSAWPAP